MLKKKIFIPLMIVLAISLTACTTDPVEEEVESQPAPVEEEMPEEMPEEDTPDVNLPDVDVEVDVDGAENYEDVKISPEEVFDIYMEKYPDTMVAKIELDQDFGSYMYKIEGFDGEKEYELKINPVNGEITKDDIDNEILEDDDKDEIITRANAEKVQALVDKSLEDAGEEGKLKDWELDYDDGRAVLEIEIDKEAFDDIEYKYDVESGDLLEKDS